MKIDKAIEILQLIRDTPPSGATLNFVVAVKLGIEALKAFQESRRAGGLLQGFLLPGETEE